MTNKEATEKLAEVMVALREAGYEKEEDQLLDLMDRLVHWCSDASKIYLDKPV